MQCISLAKRAARREGRRVAERTVCNHSVGKLCKTLISLFPRSAW
jgi:hypothetical protein